MRASTAVQIAEVLALPLRGRESTAPM